MSLAGRPAISSSGRRIMRVRWQTLGRCGNCPERSVLTQLRIRRRWRDASLSSRRQSAQGKSPSLLITTSPLIRCVVPALQTLWYRPVASALSGRPREYPRSSTNIMRPSLRSTLSRQLALINCSISLSQLPGPRPQFRAYRRHG